MSPDVQLLTQFLQEGSEPAFAELVRRHLDLVHAAALRQLAGNSALAQDVTQAVFAELLRNAPRLVRHPSLAGWLHVTASHLAARARRAEQRRTRREHSYVAMSDRLHATPDDPTWTELRPVLDEVLGSLSATDRELVVLRFFQDRSVSEIARTFGLAENTARMRIDRALDRLRHRLSRRGMTSTAAALTGMLAAHAAPSAPPALASLLTPAVLASATTSTLSSLLPPLGLLPRALETTLLAKNWILATSLAAWGLAWTPALRPTPAIDPTPVEVRFTAPIQETTGNPAMNDNRTPLPTWTWDSVESTDYRMLVANLRASGIPEPLLRDFIALDLLQHYGRKAATIRSTSPAATTATPYWRKPSNPYLDPQLRQQLHELEHERLAVLRGLFGPEVRPQDAWNLLNGGADHDAIRFAWLPPEQLAAALAVLQPDLDLETQVNSTPGMREVDPDEEQARLERRIAALKPLLTPAQLEEFRLREDPHTEEVRSLTHYCNLSADDFRRIAPLRKELLHRPAVTWEDQQSLEAEVSRLLGTAKAREFVRGMDHTYIYALRVTEHLGLPADVAHRIWEIKREAMASAATLASLPDIPDADRTRQHRDIAERTTREFKGLVGDDGFRVLRTDWPFWQNLERPGSVPSNRRKR